jgi:aspartate aminotransferase-like enzyme
MFERKGLRSIAPKENAAPGVLVYYSPKGVDNMTMVKRFLALKIQIAAGVPWKINEPAGLLTFRIGLFGLDKLLNIDQTIATLEDALDKVINQ